MLIISRKKNQKIIVADNIEITVLEVGRNRVRFGINAPKHIPIHTHLKESPLPQSVTEVIESEPQARALQSPPAASPIQKTLAEIK